jgi:hypothetical protein
MTNLLDININDLQFYHSGKNYYNINDNMGKQIIINNLNGHLPFGVEKFNDKILLNIELLDTNENNNIISIIESIEKNISNKFPNIGLNCCVKKSKLGHIIRTHILKNTECYILKKNQEKMLIDQINLKLSDAEINLTIKGIWTNDNNYGLYIVVNSIKVIKFN